jgi:hypothetical protein
MNPLHGIGLKAAGHAPNLRHRMDAVARVLRGDDLEEIARDTNVPVKQIELWSKEFCRAGEMRLRQLPENWIERCLSSTEKLVPLATLISVLLAVMLFIQGQRKEAAEHARVAIQERELRVRDAYSSLDDKYLDYVKMCLEHPDLDVFDTPIVNPAARTAEQQRRESMILSTLLSILERAYLMYNSPSDEFERNQWAAWSAYMSAWSGRTNFQAEWANSKKEFAPNFAGYIDGLMRGNAHAAGTDRVGSKGEN